MVLWAVKTDAPLCNLAIVYMCLVLLQQYKLDSCSSICPLFVQKAGIPRSVIQVLETPAEVRRGVAKAAKGKSEKRRRQSSEATSENQENPTGVS